MLFQFKNLALAAALALGGVTATDVVPVPQAQAEKEVQRDGGNLKLLRAATLKGQEVQRDAIPPFVPDTKRRDQNPGDVESFVSRQLEKYDPKMLAQSISVLEASQAKLEREDEILLERVSALGTSQEGLAQSISHLEAFDDLIAQSISHLEGRVDGLIAQSISDLGASQERLNERVDNLETSPGEMTVAEASDRARARDEINQLSRYEFLNLISLSDGPGRAALTRARTDYHSMFVTRHFDDSRGYIFRSTASFDFASYDIMDTFDEAEWEDIYVKFGIPDQTGKNRNALPRRAIIKTNDLHLSEWQIPENADVGQMFALSRNMPDLSNWTLTDEYYMYGTNSQVFHMFSGAVATEESKCPCINGKQCCPSKFNHGDACENAQAECVRNGAGIA